MIVPRRRVLRQAKAALRVAAETIWGVADPEHRRPPRVTDHGQWTSKKGNFRMEEIVFESDERGTPGQPAVPQPGAEMPPRRTIAGRGTAAGGCAAAGHIPSGVAGR